MAQAAGAAARRRPLQSLLGAACLAGANPNLLPGPTQPSPVQTPPQSNAAQPIPLNIFLTCVSSFHPHKSPPTFALAVQVVIVLQVPLGADALAMGFLAQQRLAGALLARAAAAQDGGSSSGSRGGGGGCRAGEAEAGILVGWGGGSGRQRRADEMHARPAHHALNQPMLIKRKQQAAASGGRQAGNGREGGRRGTHAARRAS